MKTSVRTSAMQRAKPIGAGPGQTSRTFDGRTKRPALFGIGATASDCDAAGGAGIVSCAPLLHAASANASDVAARGRYDFRIRVLLIDLGVVRPVGRTPCRYLRMHAMGPAGIAGHPFPQRSHISMESRACAETREIVICCI